METFLLIFTPIAIIILIAIEVYFNREINKQKKQTEYFKKLKGRFNDK